MSAVPKGTIVWHSAGFSLPQVGQIVWLQLVTDCGRVVRKARFVQGGYGTDPVWTFENGFTLTGAENHIKGWCPEEAINLE